MEPLPGRPVRPFLAFSVRIIYTSERQCGRIDLFTGKRKKSKRSGAHETASEGTANQSINAAIDQDTIVLKSPRGREEVQTRAHDLPSLARRLLIMADGRRTVSDLARELACDPDDPTLYETIQQLVDDRYLHVADEYDRRDRRPPRRRGRRATA